ncbi:MAG: glycosyltransferase family 4 protein [Methylococcaceae bacterium]|jgi:glycosyltransferase involved in cell wall biosynthesis
MIIGIDGRSFYGRYAGTGRYVAEVCKVLNEHMPEALFLVYGNRSLSLPISSKRWIHRGDEVGSSRVPSSLWYFCRAGLLANRDGVDAFWGAANFLPLSLNTHILSILTVHDVVFRLFPDTLTLTHRLAYRLFFKYGLTNADFLAVNSQGTLERLHELYGVNADVIMRPCVSDHFIPQTTQAITLARERFNINHPYFLSVSTQEPRKNLISLIEAFVRFCRTSREAELVLVGQDGWKNTKLDKVIKKARDQGATIKLTGYVEDRWLPSLYSGAQAVVMPSLYEGFGMPVAEALCCGANVIASDVPEIREAGSNAVTYISPTVQGILKALTDAMNTPKGVHNSMSTGIDKDRHSSNWHSEAFKLIKLLKSRV